MHKYDESCLRSLFAEIKRKKSNFRPVSLVDWKQEKVGQSHKWQNLVVIFLDVFNKVFTSRRQNHNFWITILTSQGTLISDKCFENSMDLTWWPLDFYIKTGDDLLDLFQGALTFQAQSTSAGELYLNLKFRASLNSLEGRYHDVILTSLMIRCSHWNEANICLNFNQCMCIYEHGWQQPI